MGLDNSQGQSVVEYSPSVKGESDLLNVYFSILLKAFLTHIASYCHNQTFYANKYMYMHLLYS